MKRRHSDRFCVILLCTATALLAVPRFFAHAEETGADQPPFPDAAQVRTAGAGLVSRVAPGELLPISVTLSNFGSQKRVDVAVAYEIVDVHGQEIYSSHETVAVETTASFIKTIQIPFGTPPGPFVARSSVTYEDQTVPATTQFPFMVERKIAGLFQSDFYLYGGTALLASAAFGLIGNLWMTRRRTRTAPMEYPNVPRAERVFYELISDTIAQMRQHMGDRALEVAMSVDDLVIDEHTGRVLKLKKSPAKIMAVLVLKYEKLLGQKVNFSFSNADSTPEDRLSSLDKNLVMIKKHFD